MVTEKDKETKVLAQIEALVKSLGEDSYVGAAFEGCFEIARENILNDFACSVRQRAELDMKEQVEKLVRSHAVEISKLQEKIDKLKAQLKQEQEWKPFYGNMKNMSQEDYDRLGQDECCRILSEEEAKNLLYEWYGFAKERLKILDSIPLYEVNRHRLLQAIGEVERRPAYSATDWNYIRFDCAGVPYELVDGTLYFGD